VNRLTIAIAAIALIGTSAFVADIATKAPAPAPASVYNWTGWYVGVNAGASFGKVTTDYNAAPATITVSFMNTAGAVVGSATGPINGFAGSNTQSPDGFMGGGQIGYNWQVSPIWVVGLETDFQGAIEKDRDTFTKSFST
jgi:outer membrane immunogenic protein